eukprot:CAMPEP_0205934316 /NCGR_PEP_ID=MMETSP1325-20131115/36053_1 /ASSEMBLY_ACC=CAM_ASM_000708 /TAXON_ID=236786 /ORGANISM="Florenciella sp., Strain RCC1007" /LENGTH=96 /DNA_ID=CAMNT_0053304281 /DNA_START=69 /DNA_END=355 /DNA_ORIENTATION=-
MAPSTWSCFDNGMPVSSAATVSARAPAGLSVNEFASRRSMLRGSPLLDTSPRSIGSPRPCCSSLRTASTRRCTASSVPSGMVLPGGESTSMKHEAL